MNLNLTLDADAGGLIGAVRRATTTLKDFGVVGGVPIIAVKTALGGVEAAAKGVAVAGRGAVSMLNALASAGTNAMGSVVTGGKGAVAILNQINGAVELANKVIPSLTFPLAMASNAERTKGAFEELKTSWQGVAGALGEGINDALTPILRSAGVEVGKLKEKAREVGQGLGDAIDFTRVSYQMEKLPEIFWVGLQKTMIQWGNSLLNLIQDAGYAMAHAMEKALSKTIIFWNEKAPGWLGGNDPGKAASERAYMQKSDEEYAKPRPNLFNNDDKLKELSDQMEALSAPVKKRAAEEKAASEQAQASARLFGQLNTAIQSGISAFMDMKAPKGGSNATGGRHSGNGAGGGGGRVNLTDQGQAAARATVPNNKLAGALGLGQEKAGEQGPPSTREERREARANQTTIRGAGFGKKDKAREGLGFFNGTKMPSISTPGLDGLKSMNPIDSGSIAKGVTNRPGKGRDDKQERKTEQKDAKLAAAVEAVLKTLPRIEESLDIMKRKLSLNPV